MMDNGIKYSVKNLGLIKLNLGGKMKINLPEIKIEVILQNIDNEERKKNCTDPGQVYWYSAPATVTNLIIQILSCKYGLIYTVMKCRIIFFATRVSRESSLENSVTNIEH